MAANGSVLGGDRALTVEIRPVYERTDDPARVRGFYSAIRQWIQLAYQYSLEYPETDTEAQNG